MKKTTQSVQTSSFSDVDRFVGSLPGNSITATPLRVGAFLAEITSIRLGDIVLRIGRSTPFMTLGVLAPDHVHILLPLLGREAIILDGRPVGSHGVAVYGAGAPHDGAIPVNASWASVILPAASVDALLSPPRRSPIRRSGGQALLRTAPAAWTRAASLVRAVMEVTATNAEVFEVEETRRGLRASVLDAVRELLSVSGNGAPPRAFRNSPVRRRIVWAVDDYLRAHPNSVASITDLSAALGLPPSRLRSAFAATFGMGLQRYLRLRRLAMARSAVHSGDPRWRSAAQIALAHGFWDLERFAREYRDMFGEDPFTTFDSGFVSAGHVRLAEVGPRAQG